MNIMNVFYFYIFFIFYFINFHSINSILYLPVIGEMIFETNVVLKKYTIE